MNSQYFIWVAVLTVALLLLEVVLGRHKGAYRKGDWPLMIGSFFLGRWLMAPLAIGLIASLYQWLLPQSWAGSLSEAPFVLTFPALLLVGEFVFYWVHRWAHQPKSHPVLWKIHRTHHSGRHMNVMLDFRLNLSWFFIIPSGWINGLALYLGMVEAVTTYVLLLMTWNTVTHANFRWDDALRRHAVVGPWFRALEHIVVTPGIHHTHHGYGKDGKNYRNFCTVLSFWDWVFGTLHLPEGRPAHYGIPGKDPHWLEELAYPLIKIEAKEK